MANGLDLFSKKLAPGVVADIESWKYDPELSKLRQKLCSIKDSQPFLDHYAEVVIARYLKQRSCTLTYEMPTANSRSADFGAYFGDNIFFVHIKRLNFDCETEKENRIHTRLQSLRKIPRPIILTGSFGKCVTHAEMQEIYKRLVPFVRNADIGETISIEDATGQEVAEFEIGPNHSGKNVEPIVLMSVKCIDDQKRFYKKLTEAYEQFMPEGLNIILVTSSWKDDLEDFEAALLGTTYEVFDGLPPLGKVVKRGRKSDGFWSDNKHSASYIVGWFSFSIKEETISFKMWYRDKHEIPNYIRTIFPG